MSLVVWSAVPVTAFAEGDGNPPPADNGGADGTAGGDGGSGTDGGDGLADGENGNPPAPGEDGDPGDPGQNGGDTNPDQAPSGDEGTAGDPGTPGNDGGEQTGDGSSSIDTGDTSASADVNNNVNNSSVDTSTCTTPSSTEEQGPVDEGSGATGGEGSEGSTEESVPTEGGNQETSGTGGEESTGDNVPAEESTGETTDAPEEICESGADANINLSNDGTVGNSVGVDSGSGANSASGNNGNVSIETGNSAAIANVVNVVNLNMIEASALFLLLSNLRSMVGNLDIRTLHPMTAGGEEGSTASSDGCSTCNPVDLSVTATNNATITNDVVVRSTSGGNEASGNGGDASISTGNAFAAATVANIANVNLIDSSYFLLSFNNIGDWGGDLVFPAASFFSNLFARPGPSAVADNLAVDVTNNATVNNNATTTASTGDNAANNNEGSSLIQTGTANAGTSIITNANNVQIGGSSIMVLVRITGSWSGNVFGAPRGVSWVQTPQGLMLFSDGTGGGGTGSGDAATQGGNGTLSNLDVTTTNNATITNNIEVAALTGENRANDNGGNGTIRTGNAFAATSIFNLVNTTVIGRNVILAMINIFGDWNGNLAFGRPNLWIGGQAQSGGSFAPGAPITYRFSIVNNGDADATQVYLDSLLDARLSLSDAATPSMRDGNHVRWNIGTIPVGGSTELVYTASVGNLPYGDTVLTTTANTGSYETDENASDNTESLSLIAFRPNPEPLPPPPGYNPGFTAPPFLKVMKTNSATGPVAAGGSVDYKIMVTNENGGPAYDTMLKDVVRAEDGTIINRRMWNLGKVLPNETIEVTYTVAFSEALEPGVYENTAEVEALAGYSDFTYGYIVSAGPAKSSVEITEPVNSGGGGGSGGFPGDGGNSGAEVTQSSITTTGDSTAHDGTGETAADGEGEPVTLAFFAPQILGGGSGGNGNHPPVSFVSEEVLQLSNQSPFLAAVLAVGGSLTSWLALAFIVLALIVMLIRRQLELERDREEHGS